MPTKKGYQMRRVDIHDTLLRKLSINEGSISHHVENALNMYFRTPYHIYKITNTIDGSYFLDFYDCFGVQGVMDVSWHEANARGSDSIGHCIREVGSQYFTFEVVSRCGKVAVAERIMKSLNANLTKSFKRFIL